MATSKSSVESKAPAFVHREGIGLQGTPITCDGPGLASDLVFIASAYALQAKDIAKLTKQAAGRRQILATQETLALLGRAGEAMRPRVLPSTFGMPFNLGDFRIELISSGYLPGAAALFVEGGGKSFLHVGRFCREVLWEAVIPAEIRKAGAVCLDASFADPRIVFPPRREVLEELRDFARRAAEAEKPVVLFVSSMAPLDVLATTLAPLKVRAHGALLPFLDRLSALSAHPPRVVRYAEKVAPGEVLLWPLEEWDSPRLDAFPTKVTAWVSGHAADPMRLSRPVADRAFPVSNQSSHAELIRFILETGCGEVALYNGYAETFAEALRGQGLAAYVLESPRQMNLLDP